MIAAEGYVTALMRVLVGDHKVDEQVMDHALSYGIDPIVSCVFGLPEWRMDRMALLAQAVWRRNKLFELIDQVNADATHDWLLLKGEAIAQRMFADASLRRSGDLDLLVRFDDIDDWGDALAVLGYMPMYGDAPEPWLYDQWAFVHPVTELVIELHWAIAPPPMPVPDFETLWQASQEITLGSRVVRTLSDGHTLVHLCYHFHHHAGFLKGLVDVAGWCDRFVMDPYAVRSALELARALGVMSMVRWPLKVLSMIGGLSGVQPERQVVLEEVIARGPMRSPGVISWSEAMAMWTRRVLNEALCVDASIDAGSSLAFKTHGVMQSQVMLWQMVGYGAADDWRTRLRLLTFPIWRDPWVVAYGRGADGVGLRDVCAVALRPLTLIRKGIVLEASAGDNSAN